MLKKGVRGSVVKDDANIHDTLKYGLNRRNNCFITGPAGTGKSYITDQVVQHSDALVVVTASTGVAAMNVGGVTVHSWSNMGIKSHPKMLEKIFKDPRWQYAESRILAADVVFIDEVGMLTAGQMDLFDAICRYAYYKKEWKSCPPFGGLQVVCTGDFLQIPPVSKNNMQNSGYFWPFESTVWKQGAFHTYSLSKIYRQSNLDFAGVLNKMRMGIVDKEVTDMLASRVNVPVPKDVTPMKFVGTNELVRNGNLEEYKKATGKAHSFLAKTLVAPKMIKYAEGILNELSKNSRMEKEIYVKEGMPVVMLVNRNTMTEQFMNGSLATFVGIDAQGLPIVEVQKTGARFSVTQHVDELKNGDGSIKATITQYPFRLAYYTTFHKSQGLTLDYAEVNMSSIFGEGMAYVGCSRVTSLNGLFIKNFVPRNIKANKKALAFYRGGKK